MLTVRERSCPPLLFNDALHSVFSRVFPGPSMPWNNNPMIQLQDMYDKVYSHLISSSQHRDTILQVLGQVIIAKGMPDDVDALGISANSSSPRHIATILGLEHDLVMRIAADFHLLLEGGDESSDIKIRQPSFLEFLLDFSRSQELFVDVNEATLRAIFHAEGMYVHPLPRTLIFMSLHQCFPWSLQIYTQAKT